MINISIKGSFDMYSKKQNNFYIKYINAGFQTSNTGWSHKKRHLDNYELIFVTKGIIFLQEDEIRYELKENDILILSPYRIISSYNLSEQPVSFYWAVFSTDKLDAFQLSGNYYKTQNSYEFAKLFKELIYVAKSKGYPVYTVDIMISMILSKLAAGSQKNIQKSKVDVMAITEWIDENINVNNTVDMISKTFNYNKDYLCRVFKSEMGITLKEYINAEQIDKSKSLLMTSNYSIKQISDILGYGNENLFIKFFKYHVKISPTKYRNKFNLLT